MDSYIFKGVEFMFHAFSESFLAKIVVFLINLPYAIFRKTVFYKILHTKFKDKPLLFYSFLEKISLRDGIIVGGIKNYFDKVFDFSTGYLKILLIILLLFCILGLVFSMNITIAAFGLLTVGLIIWKTEIGIIFTIFMLPFVKTTFIIILAAVTIASYILGPIKFNKNIINVFVLIFGLVFAYASVSSGYLGESLGLLAMYLIFIGFYFVVINTVKTPKLYKAVILSGIISAAIVAAYGIFQTLFYQGGAASWIDNDMFQDIKFRAYSTLENPNVLGEYMTIFIPLTLAAAFSFRNHLMKLVLFLSAFLMGACLMYTWSRGAWVAAGAAIFTFVFLKDRKLAASLVLILMISLPLAVVLGIMPSNIINRITSIGNLKDSSTAYRVSIWLASLDMAKDFFFIGIGTGTNTFLHIYNKYAFSGAAFALHSHNLFLQILIETGIFGIISFFIMVVLFYNKILCSHRKIEDDFNKFSMMAIAGSMVGYLIHGIADNTWYNHKIAFLFFILLAFAVSGDLDENKKTS